MVYPSNLQAGDKVMILSPASAIKPELVSGACEALRQWGFVPEVSTHCIGHEFGNYAATDECRLADLRQAFLDPSVKAILCSRGGYGVCHLLEHIEPELIARNPKWLIGFSDISALHAAMQRSGVASIHASMAKHLAEHGIDDECSRALHAIISGGSATYSEASHPFNRCGEATAALTGGNLAVLCGLLDSDFDILRPGHILFIEDIAEPIYKVERMLYNLRLNGVLPNLAGLVVGQFTEYRHPDSIGDDMEQMIRRMVAPYSYPVAFNFPIGHVERNLPIIEGCQATLAVTPDGVTLEMKRQPIPQK